MQDDHPYDMVDTETASLFHRHTHHTGLVQDQASTKTVKEDYISSEAFQAPIHYFSTPPERVQTWSYPTSHPGR